MSKYTKITLHICFQRVFEFVIAVFKSKCIKLSDNRLARYKRFDRFIAQRSDKASSTIFLMLDLPKNQLRSFKIV